MCIFECWNKRLYMAYMLRGMTTSSSSHDLLSEAQQKVQRRVAGLGQVVAHELEHDGSGVAVKTNFGFPWPCGYQDSWTMTGDTPISGNPQIVPHLIDGSFVHLNMTFPIETDMLASPWFSKWRFPTPKSSIFNGIFHYKPSIWGYPHGYGNPPNIPSGKLT